MFVALKQLRLVAERVLAHPKKGDRNSVPLHRQVQGILTGHIAHKVWGCAAVLARQERRKDGCRQADADVAAGIVAQTNSKHGGTKVGELQGRARDLRSLSMIVVVADADVVDAAMPRRYGREAANARVKGPAGV